MSNRLRCVFVKSVVLSMFVVPAGAAGCGRGSGLRSSTAADASSSVLQGVFVPTGSMNEIRGLHTATLLPSGKVLIAGGEDVYSSPLASAELYDPSAGTFTATGTMTVARDCHTATLLPSGKVLVAGGFGAHSDILASAELYDPSAGTFTATGSMTVGRLAHTATLLPSGKVLIAGGEDITDVSVTTLSSEELYDPSAGTFRATGTLTVTRSIHTATLLQDGKVLIAGGFGALGDILSSAEIYDPRAGTFTATGSMTVTRYSHTATLLQNGKVLIVGGSDSKSFGSEELYDPSLGTFAPTGMTDWRWRHSATLLPDGKVLVAGGDAWVFDGASGLSNGVPIASAELYDPAVGTFAATGSMTVARDLHAATLLQNGTVLIAGGYLSSAELYE